MKSTERRGQGQSPPPPPAPQETVQGPLTRFVTDGEQTVYYRKAGDQEHLFYDRGDGTEAQITPQSLAALLEFHAREADRIRDMEQLRNAARKVRQTFRQHFQT